MDIFWNHTILFQSLTVCYTVEALVSRLPRDVRKVSITGAGHLQRFKNTEFVWELKKKTVFCEGGHK